MLCYVYSLQDESQGWIKGIMQLLPLIMSRSGQVSYSVGRLVSKNRAKTMVSTKTHNNQKANSIKIPLMVW